MASRDRVCFENRRSRLYVGANYHVVTVAHAAEYTACVVGFLGDFVVVHEKSIVIGF